MSKVTITSQTTVITKKEVELPAFFKDRQIGHYIAIVEVGRHISVNTGGFTKMISYYSWNPDLSEEKHVQIDANEFYAAFHKCIQDVTKEVACAIA